MSTCQANPPSTHNAYTYGKQPRTLGVNRLAYVQQIQPVAQHRLFPKATSTTSAKKAAFVGGKI